MKGLLALVVLLIACLAGTAANALPQMTPSCNKNIAPPDAGSRAAEIDAGVLFSADCSIVYIMPPKVGAIDLSAVAPSANVTQCPAVYDANESVNLAEEAKKVGMQKATEASKSGDGVAFVNYATLVRNADALARDLAVSLERYSAVEGATAAVLIKLEYNELIKAYSDKNPGVQFQKLPIKAGFMSYKSLLLDPLTFAAMQKSRPAALEIVVAGIQDKSLDDFNITSPDAQATINFSDSAGGSIKLSLNGACPFYDKTTQRLVPYDFSKPTADMRGYLAATYSYFYPIQTKGSYKITFDSDVLGDMVKKLVEERNGDVSASVLAEDILDINATQAFRIEVTQDLNNSLPDEAKLNDRFTAALASSFVQDLLSKLGTLTKQEEIPNIDTNFTGFRDEVQRGRSCSRGGFLGLSSSCSDFVYTIKVPANQVKERVKAVSVDLYARYSMSGVQINTVIFSGTTGFKVRVGQ